MKRMIQTIIALFICVGLFAQADLSLTGSIDNNDPGQYKYITLTLTVTNDGPEDATNVVITSPTFYPQASYGLVLDTYTATAGTYTWLAQWEIPLLEAGATETAEIRLFTMKPQVPLILGQVTSVDQDDPDSTPGNLSYDALMTNGEDDEFMINSNEPNCDIRIVIEDEKCNGSANQVRLRVETDNPDYERFKLVFRDFDGDFRVTDIQANTSENYYFFQPRNSSYELIATPFNSTDNCFDQIEDGYFEYCGNNAPCRVYPFFTIMNCVENGVSGDKYWNINGSVRATQQGRYELFVNDELINSYYTSQQFFVGGIDSDLSIADNPEVTIRIEGVGAVEGCNFEQTYSANEFCDNNSGTAYCMPVSDFPWHEYISSVTIDDITNTSMATEYSDYTSTPIGPIAAGSTIPFDITIQYSWITYDEYVRTWIDFNADGIFSSDEIAFQGKLVAPPSGALASGGLSGFITIPATASNGTTRMRVVVSRSGYSRACDRINYGEYEDYSLNITGGDQNGCQVEAVITDISCNNNGTSMDASDDVFFFTYTATGTGIDATERLNLIDQRDTTSSYNTTNAYINTAIQMGPYSIVDMPTVTINHVGSLYPFSDILPCRVPAVTVDAPTTCSEGTPTNCGDIIVSVDNYDCQLNTPYTSFDDTYSFDLTLTSDDLIEEQYTLYNARLDSEPLNYDAANAVFNEIVTVQQVGFQYDPTMQLIVELASGTSCVLDPIQIAPPTDCYDGGGDPTTPDCRASSEFPWEDWISNVTIGDMTNQSGKTKYGDYRYSNIITASAGDELAVSLSATWSWFTYDAYWRVWMDLNGDSIYTEDEIAFEGKINRPPDGSVTRSITGTITLPSDVEPGSYSVRVIMNRNGYTPPCGVIPNGEVEDYSIDIEENILQVRSSNLSFTTNEVETSIAVWPNPAMEYTQLALEPLKGQEVSVSIIDIYGKVIQSWHFEDLQEPSMIINTSDYPSGIYYLMIQPSKRILHSEKLIIQRP